MNDKNFTLFPEKINFEKERKSFIFDDLHVLLIAVAIMSGRSLDYIAKGLGTSVNNLTNALKRSGHFGIIENCKKVINEHCYKQVLVKTTKRKLKKWEVSRRYVKMTDYERDKEGKIILIGGQLIRKDRLRQIVETKLTVEEKEPDTDILLHVLNQTKGAGISLNEEESRDIEIIIDALNNEVNDIEMHSNVLAERAIEQAKGFDSKNGDYDREVLPTVTEFK